MFAKSLESNSSIFPEANLFIVILYLSELPMKSTAVMRTGVARIIVFPSLAILEPVPPNGIAPTTSIPAFIKKFFPAVAADTCELFKSLHNPIPELPNPNNNDATVPYPGT